MIKFYLTKALPHTRSIEAIPSPDVLNFALRVEIEARERAKEIDIICKEKEKRAEACLEKRREKIKTWRESDIIFNPW